MALGRDKKRVGELRHPATIEEFVEDTDEYGNPIETWDKIADTWGGFESLTGREFWDAKQAQSEITGKFKTRYVSGVEGKKELRIKLYNRELQVESVFDPDGKQRELHFMIKEGASNG